MTVSNSVSSAGELISVSVPTRSNPTSPQGAPRHSRPDSSTLVSMTVRTLPPFGTNSLHFGIDLVHRHRFHTCFLHAYGYRKQRFRRPLALHRVNEKPLERLRR